MNSLFVGGGLTCGNFRTLSEQPSLHMAASTVCVLNQTTPSLKPGCIMPMLLR